MNPCADPDHCITCSDAAVPMRVEALREEPGLAVCDGVIVDVTLVQPVDPGDLVLVHAATALARLEEEDVA
jgi:hydrogenase maturation factor